MMNGTRHNAAWNGPASDGAALELEDMLHDPRVRRVAEAARLSAAAGELVRRRRSAQGRSQQWLAAKVGTTVQQIGDWERGLGAPPLTVATLAQILVEFGDELVVGTRSEGADAKQEGSMTEAVLAGIIAEVQSLRMPSLQALIAEGGRAVNAAGDAGMVMAIKALVLGYALATRVAPSDCVTPGDANLAAAWIESCLAKFEEAAPPEASALRA